jgi:hypothetical protein
MAIIANIESAMNGKIACNTMTQYTNRTIQHAPTTYLHALITYVQAIKNSMTNSW